MIITDFPGLNDGSLRTYRNKLKEWGFLKRADWGNNNPPAINIATIGTTPQMFGISLLPARGNPRMLMILNEH